MSICRIGHGIVSWIRYACTTYCSQETIVEKSVCCQEAELEIAWIGVSAKENVVVVTISGKDDCIENFGVGEWTIAERKIWETINAGAEICA